MATGVILRKSCTYTKKENIEIASPVKPQPFFLPFSWCAREVDKYVGKALREEYNNAQEERWVNPPTNMINARPAFCG